MTYTQFCYLVCGVLSPGNFTLESNELKLILFQKYLLLASRVLLCNCFQVLDGDCDDPTLVESTTATKYGMCTCVVDNMVDMGIVNTSNIRPAFVCKVQSGV